MIYFISNGQYAKNIMLIKYNRNYFISDMLILLVQF